MRYFKSYRRRKREHWKLEEHPLNVPFKSFLQGRKMVTKFLGIKEKGNYSPWRKELDWWKASLRIICFNAKDGIQHEAYTAGRRRTTQIGYKHIEMCKRSCFGTCSRSTVAKMKQCSHLQLGLSAGPVLLLSSLSQACLLVCTQAYPKAFTLLHSEICQAWNGS